MPTQILNNVHFNSIPVIVDSSVDGTHFVDQNNNPRLFVGEDNWALLGNGGAWASGGDTYLDVWADYFTARQAQGYNAVEVTWCSFPQPERGAVKGARRSG